jgi:hypothetical protein
MKMAKEVFMYVLAAIVMLLLFTSIAFILIIEIPGGNKDLAYMAFGLALGWGSMVISYFFGSSKGSADKTEMLKAAEPEVWGCMDKGADNYNPKATRDDGSCKYTANPDPNG